MFKQPNKHHALRCVLNLSFVEHFQLELSPKFYVCISVDLKLEIVIIPNLQSYCSAEPQTPPEKQTDEVRELFPADVVRVVKCQTAESH